MSSTTPTRATTHRRPAVTAATVAAVLLVGLAGCGTDRAGLGGPDPVPSGPSASSASSTPGTPASGPRNTADVLFAQGMIPHHQQAVEMSDLILAKEGVDGRVQDLAREIKAAQAPEIATMSGWLAGWGEGPAGAGHGMDHGGGGMLSPADLEQLAGAGGNEASRLFLEGMIEHHRGAVRMAQQEIANGQNPEAIRLARAIVGSQEEEIERMKQLIDEL